MAYRDDITALSPDHLWPLEADSNDTVGSINGTDTSITYTGTACCEDASNAAVTNDVGDRIDFPTSADIDGALSQKAVAGWLRVSQIQGPPKSIWREGTAADQFNIVMWAGNVVMLDIVESSTVIQVTSDQIFEPDRDYHICAVFEGTGFADRTALYIDGVEQSGSGDAGGLATITARTGAEMADPSGATEVGNATVLLNAPVNGFYNFWATWSGSDAALTTTEIREELFEKGAQPSQTIDFDTEANMQTDLDVFADTVRGDEPLNFRVEGDKDGTLTVAGATGSDNGNTTSWTVDYPGSRIANGDLLVLLVAIDGNSQLVDPVGWTSQVDYFESNEAWNLHVYTKVADGTESGSLSLTNSIAEVCLGCMLHVTGGADPNTLTIATNDPAALGTNINFASRTTAEDNALVIGVVGTGRGDRSFTFPAGWTEHYNPGAVAGSGTSTSSPSLGVASRFQATAGVTDNGNITFDIASAFPVSHVLTIEPNGGSAPAPTDITLEADNITHDPKASIHVQWTGQGTLTWVNTNGSNASIGSTPDGGTINFVEAVPLTITVRDASTNAVIEGARVLLEASSGGPLASGTDILTGTTNVSGQITGSLQYSADQPITGRIRKGTSSPLYKTGVIAGTITTAGLDLTVFMVGDE